MNGFKRFLTLFKTNIVTAENIKLVKDPVTFEVFNDPRKFMISLQQAKVFPSNETINFNQRRLLETEQGTHLAFITRTKIKGPDAQEFVENETDKVITALSALYKPEIFDQLVYRGWLLEPDVSTVTGVLRIADKVSIDEDELEKTLRSFNFNLENNDMSERFKLMSRFYSKSLLYDPAEEKFLFLWTVLEIYPMKNDSDIEPLVLYLAGVMGKDPVIVKEKLGLGRMFGKRSDLVHDGLLSVPIKDRSDFFTKLEDIVLTVLRDMLKLPYDSRLDKHIR